MKNPTNFKEEIFMKQTQYIITKLLSLLFLLGISLCCSIKTDAKITTELHDNGNIFKVTGTGHLNIDKDIKGVEETYLFSNNAKISKITVSKDNKYLASKNDVLYNKKMTKLIYFPSNKKIVSFKVPDTVKIISPYAFADNRYLQKVKLNNKIKTIHTGAFQNSNIESINIPHSVVYIGQKCFEGCINLETVDNNSNITEIYDYTFKNCTSLKEINFGSSVKKISFNAFENCGTIFNIATDNENYTSQDGILYSKDMKELIKYPGLKHGNYILPASIKSINVNALTMCINLKSFTLNDNITEFPISQLTGCSSLQVLNLNEKLEFIGNVYNSNNKLFSYDIVYGLSSLKEINIPEQNKYFKTYDNALYSADYKYLWLIPFAKTSLDIHENTEIIINKYCQNNFNKITVPSTSNFFTSYKGVLYDKNIKSIEIFPDMLTNYKIPATLEDASFLINYTILDENYYANGCINVALNLENITVESGNKYFKSKSGVLFSSDMTKLYIFPRAKKGKYVIPVNTKYMDADAFAGAYNLTELTVPANIKSLNINVAGCTSLRKIVFKEGIEKIYLYGGSQTDENRFKTCLNIKNIFFPSTIDTIGIYAINNSAVFHAYDNTGIYAAEYSDYEFIQHDIKSIKDYIINKKYIFQTRGAAPGKIKKLSAYWKNKKIKISWNPVENADGYLMYITNNKIYNKLKNVKKTKTSSITIKSSKYIPIIYVKAYKNINKKRVYGKQSRIIVQNRNI